MFPFIFILERDREEQAREKRRDWEREVEASERGQRKRGKR